MLRNSLLGLILGQASAINLAQEEDLPQCSLDDPAQWLPSIPTEIDNPEIERQCEPEDAENNFQDCDCIPARMIEWDTDPDMMTDITMLGVE